MLRKDFIMTLKLGEKIRELRKSSGKTQEALANALGITCQAVSRWEQNDAYPDMELIPPIANFFGISIDELFGYECERDKKIDEIVARVEAYHIRSRVDDDWISNCISVLRQGLAEFPRNEKLLITLAETLSEAGWRKYHEWLYYDGEGYMCHRCDKHRDNEYWKEAVKICESLAGTTRDNEIFTRASHILVLLYRNIGEYEKAVSYARRMPSLSDSREILLASAADGKEAAEYIGNALLKIVSEFSELLIHGLMANKGNYETDMPIDKIKGVISMFYLVCGNGNFGEYHGQIIKLYLYLSRVQWERGYRDDAFVSLDNALEHARALEQLLDGGERYFTDPLVSLVKCRSGEPARIAETLPEDWPFWRSPDCSHVEKEIKADPRWVVWAEKTKQ